MAVLRARRVTLGVAIALAGCAVAACTGTASSAAPRGTVVIEATNCVDGPPYIPRIVGVTVTQGTQSLATAHFRADVGHVFELAPGRYVFHAGMATAPVTIVSGEVAHIELLPVCA